MRGDTPVASPAEMFHTATILQFSFTVAPVIYMTVGEVIRTTIDDFTQKGFVNFGDEIWPIRGAFAALSLLGLVVSHTIYSDRRLVDRALKRSGEVTNATILMQLQTAQVLRLAWTESIAIFGLMLYVWSADRLDLYPFCLVALVNFILIRPRRDDWEATFRRVAAEHPAVNPSPWSVGSS